MMYKVRFTQKADKQLRKMDAYTRNTLLSWIKKHLHETSNPRLYGKGLTSNRSGEWRYRVGNYRILANIYDDQVVIEVFAVGHRRDIYD